MNYLRTAVLLAGMTALFMGIGYLIGGQAGAMIALLVAGAMNFLAYWNADRLVLSMHDAHEVDESTAPELVSLVRDLAARAGLPMPKVYLIDNDQPNAFATGRNPRHAAIAVTTGLLEKMNRVELEGVLAHELAHVKNYDILISTLAGHQSKWLEEGLIERVQAITDKPVEHYETGREQGVGSREQGEEVPA